MLYDTTYYYNTKVLRCNFLHILQIREFMKIRLMGQSNLVRRWQRELERSYCVKGREYANRGNDPQVRIYFDLDDG